MQIFGGWFGWPFLLKAPVKIEFLKPKPFSGPFFQELTSLEAEAGKASGCLSFWMVTTDRYAPAIHNEKLIMYQMTTNIPQQKAHPRTSRDLRAKFGRQ